MQHAIEPHAQNDVRVDTWDDLAKLGVDPEKMRHILHLSQMGIRMRENESAQALFARAKARFPELVPHVFSSDEQGLQVFTEQVAYFHWSVHVSRVAQGRIREHAPSSILLACAARVGDVKILQDDTAETWAARMDLERPGVLDFLSRTKAGRDAILRRSMEAFRKDVRETRARLIIALLFPVLSLMMLISATSFGIPNGTPGAETIVRTLLTTGCVLSFYLVWLAYRVRMIYAKAEAEPEII